MFILLVFLTERFPDFAFAVLSVIDSLKEKLVKSVAAKSLPRRSALDKSKGGQIGLNFLSQFLPLLLELTTA